MELRFESGRFVFEEGQCVLILLTDPEMLQLHQLEDSGRRRLAAAAKRAVGSLLAIRDGVIPEADIAGPGSYDVTLGNLTVLKVSDQSRRTVAGLRARIDITASDVERGYGTVDLGEYALVVIRVFDTGGRAASDQWITVTGTSTSHSSPAREMVGTSEVKLDAHGEVSLLLPPGRHSLFSKSVSMPFTVEEGTDDCGVKEFSAG